MDDAMQTAKRDLRRQMKKILSEVMAESLAKQSRNVTGLLLSMPEYHAARRVGVYMSMSQGEIATGDVVGDALPGGKHIFIPYTDAASSTSTRASSTMDMVSLRSLDDYAQLKGDGWGIPSPSAESVTSRASCLQQLASTTVVDGIDRGLDMILLPGMAFDLHRGRLGHGKGYYDRFLDQYRRLYPRRPGEKAKMPFLVGLALKEQVLLPGQHVPTDSTDWPLDCLIIGDGRLLRAPEAPTSPPPPPSSTAHA